MFFLNTIIITFLLQPTIVTEFLNIFKCKQIDDSTYIISSLEISCENEEYFDWRNKFYIPYLSFWIAIFPLFSLGKLIINSKKLDLPHLKLFFGFFYLGYKPEFYFWEFCIMYRKIFAILVTLMPEDMLSTKCYILLLVNAQAVYFQKIKSPFMQRNLNSLELKANIASMLTILLGLFFRIEISNTMKTTLFFFIILSNSLFLIYWMKFFLYVIIKDLSENYFIRKLCPNLPKFILNCFKGEIFYYLFFYFLVGEKICNYYEKLSWKNLKKQTLSLLNEIQNKRTKNSSIKKSFLFD